MCFCWVYNKLCIASAYSACVKVYLLCYKSSAYTKRFKCIYTMLHADHLKWWCKLIQQCIALFNYHWWSNHMWITWIETTKPQENCDLDLKVWHVVTLILACNKSRKHAVSHLRLRRQTHQSLLETLPCWALLIPSCQWRRCLWWYVNHCWAIDIIMYLSLRIKLTIIFLIWKQG